MSTSTTLFGGIFVFACAAHIYVMSRIMPYRKDLLEGATGLRRFWDYASQSVADNYSLRSYEADAHRYLLWLRLSGVVGGIALAATVFSMA